MELTLEERLHIVSSMERDGCDEDTIEAMIDCKSGKGLVVDRLTEDLIMEIINEAD